MIAGLYKIFDHWHQEGTLYIYSDPHFGDTKLETGVHNRPTAEEQVKMINSKCGRADTLIILGDVGDVSYVRQLRAKYKILIMGNHDAGRTNYERKQYFCGYMKSSYTKEAALADMKNHYPNCRYEINDGETCWGIVADNGLFDEVYEGPLMIAEKLILSHEPLGCTWAYNIHGHVHQGAKKGTYSFNCCAEAINYTPVNFNQWMKQGYLSKIESIHRETIDRATARKKKRGGRKIGN